MITAKANHPSIPFDWLMTNTVETYHDVCRTLGLLHRSLSNITVNGRMILRGNVVYLLMNAPSVEWSYYVLESRLQ